MTVRKAFLALAMLPFCAFAAQDSSNAIIRLLNSRASGSPRGYAEAAEVVARDAAAGRPLQQFVIALVSEEPNAPAAAKIPAEKRKEYLDANRAKIRSLAERKGNGLAWYLLSLEENDAKFLKRAADAGNVQALNAWGTMTLTQAFSAEADTNDVHKALVKSFECFKSAAAQGDANGAYNLGMCYLNGYGCEKDPDLAFNCFRTASDKGHPEAINNIGGFYRDGGTVVERNLELAAKFFEKSATLGNAFGQLNLALALQRGEGVAKDDHRAFELLTESAAQGNAEAMNALGMCHYHGNGVEKNFYKAMRWYRSSAALGYAPAMDNIATCCDFGHGVQKSPESAMVWRARARAARGDRNAVSWLRQNGYSLR